MAFGRIDRAPGSAPISDINVTPLVDVMLVLVVIFLLTAPLLASSIALELPQAASAAARATAAPLVVTIDKSGQTFLDTGAVALPALAERFATAAAESGNTEVQLRADTAVPYGRVVEVIGLAQKAGLSHIGFLADPVPGG